MIEAAEQPVEWVMRILEYRAYRHAKQQLERADEPDDIPQTPMTELVWLVKNALFERRNRSEGTPSP